MSIFDIFNSKPATTPAAPAPTTPTAPTTPAPVQPGNLPAQQPADPTNVTPSDPLAEFKDLWEPVKQDENGTPQESPKLDPQKLQDVINKADFSSVISQENLAKIQQGGEEATRAFADSMNQVAQQVMYQSTLAANKLVETAVERAMAEQAAKLPNLIKSENLSTNLYQANPLFSNPAVKPVIEAVKSQLQTKNPDATPAQLTEMAQSFVTAMAESFMPKPTSNTPADDSQDWEKFLSM